MADDPLQALIGQWREQAASLMRRSDMRDDPYDDRALEMDTEAKARKQCADELDAALRSLLERRGPAEKEKSEKVTRGADSGAPPAPTGSIAPGNETTTRIVSYTYACGCRTTGVYNERCGLHGLEALSKANAEGR